MEKGLVAVVVLLGALVAVTPAPVQAASRRPPVVMIVLDEFPVGDLMAADGSLDSRRFPGFAALARGSTWFPNAHTVYDSTEKAVPAILDGSLPEPGGGPDYRSHPRSVFTLMDRLGYRIRSREEATTVCPPRLCARRNHYGNPHYNILHQRRERLESTIASLRRTRRPTFTFHHSVLPHVPWTYLPSGRNRTGYPPGTLPDFSGPLGFKDPFLTVHNEQQHLLQVGFVDREVGRLVRRLKRTGQWRNALVVVTADHGVSFQVEFAGDTVDRRKVSDDNVAAIAPVPLFVKRPGQTRGSVSRAFASTVDVLPTIAHLLRTRVGFPVDGQQAFSAAVRRRRDVAISLRDLSGEIIVPGQQLQAARRADRRRRAALFGTGPWSRVYRIGPNRKLLGRPAPANRARLARFVIPRPGALARVRPTASVVPTQASGRITRGLAEGGRDLALAVNGRVAAVGRSFHLERDRTEWFTFNLPESRLRRGHNTMALYEVQQGSKLIPLGRVR